MTIFRMEDISYGWTKDKSLFSGLNFELQKGEILSVLGPNGVGKTTFLKSILGLLPLNKGEIYIKEKK